LICNEWIDVYDICNVDTAYCDKIKRQKISEVFNNLLIFGLNIHYSEYTANQTMINRSLKLNLYIKWLIKNNIQVQYFDNKYVEYIYEQDIYKILCKLNHLILLYYDDFYKLFQLLKNNQFNNLTCICDKGNINSTEMKSMIENNLNIEELIFQYKKFDDDFIMFIIEKCEHLKFLSLDSCKQLSDLCFTKLTKQNKNLIKLFIDYCDNFTDLSLNIISKIFLNLQALSIEKNKNITDQGLIDFANNCSTLLKLNIKDCGEITNIGIIEITKKLKYLNSFQFGTYGSRGDNITDESLIAISKNCLNLNVLNIYHCEMITNIGFNALFNKNLTELYFHGCDNLNDSNVMEMSTYFSNLQVFSINFQKNLTDKSIIAITKNCKYLNTLIIDCCKNITNIGFESIAINCFNLKILSISNDNITESCLTNIIKNCLKLKKLTILDYSNNIDEYFIKNLIKKNLFITIIINDVSLTIPCIMHHIRYPLYNNDNVVYFKKKN
jgi:hypothetical protein